jgi:hypothetical protein
VRHRCSRLPQGRPYRSAPNGFLQPGRQDHGACRHARRRSPSPSARRGLPNIRMAEWGRPIAWDCEAFVGKLRDEKWSKCTITDNGEDDKLIHYLNAAPPPAARARADEIIAAFDAWTKRCLGATGNWPAGQQTRPIEPGAGLRSKLEVLALLPWRG